MKHLLLLTTLMTAGCQDSGRAVEGVFTVDGQPKAGVEVYLHGDLEGSASCGNTPPSAITDEDGKFSAIAYRFPIAPCFVTDGAAYSTFLVVSDGTKEPIQLVCKLPLVVTGHFEDGHICYPRRG